MQSWADLWDNWAKMWGYDVWEWGNVAEWVAAIGTAAALFWALKLFREEAEQRRRADAEAFYAFADIGTWSLPRRRKGPLHYSYLTLTLRNNAASPVTVQSIYIYENGALRIFRAGDIDGRELAPGKTLRFEYTDRPADAKHEVYVSFRDAAGREWLRDATKKQLLTAKEQKKRLESIGGVVHAPLPTPRQHWFLHSISRRLLGAALYARWERWQERRSDEKMDKLFDKLNDGTLLK